MLTLSIECWVSGVAGSAPRPSHAVFRRAMCTRRTRRASSSKITARARCASRTLEASGAVAKLVRPAGRGAWRSSLDGGACRGVHRTFPAATLRPPTGTFSGKNSPCAPRGNAIGVCRPALDAKRRAGILAPCGCKSNVQPRRGPARASPRRVARAAPRILPSRRPVRARAAKEIPGFGRPCGVREADRGRPRRRPGYTSKPLPDSPLERPTDELPALRLDLRSPR
jgi:hypothetical protein